MKKKIWTLGPVLSLLLWIALSAGVLLVVFATGQGSVMTPVRCNLSAPALLFLNLLPLLVTMGIVWSATGNLLWGGSASVLVWGLLSYVNLIKSEARGDPFVPGDILLVLEGVEAMGNYELNIHPKVLLMIFGLTGMLFLAGFFVKSWKPSGKTRGFMALALAVILVLAQCFCYSSDDLYKALPGPDRNNVPQVYNTMGFPYAFLHNLNFNSTILPPGYSRQEAAGYEEIYRTEPSAPDQAPNVLMIMCEAFTDLPNETVFGYTPQDNPIAFYNTLAGLEHTVSGHMIVSNTGAGTANTEFDVLNGMMTNRLQEGATSAFRYVRRKISSVPWMFREAGYETFFLHPGHSWFYNRESVYAHLGIEDQIFNDAFQESDYLGSWISDEAFLRELTEAAEARNGEAPLFCYSVTAQNHQSYTINKYGYIPEGLKLEKTVSDPSREALSVYFKGLSDSDAMLKKLVQWLDGQSEPWLLVFFGDHQPNLGGDYLVYRELGLYRDASDPVQERLSMYAVPFVIWGNEALRAETSLLDAAPDLGKDMVISSQYLGAMTAQIAGYAGLDPYFDYVNQLRQLLPVCSVYGYRTADGTWLEEPPQELAQMEEIRWNWQYYRLKHEK